MTSVRLSSDGTVKSSFELPEVQPKMLEEGFYVAVLNCYDDNGEAQRQEEVVLVTMEDVPGQRKEGKQKLVRFTCRPITKRFSELPGWNFYGPFSIMTFDGPEKDRRTLAEKIKDKKAGNFVAQSNEAAREMEKNQWYGVETGESDKKVNQQRIDQLKSWLSGEAGPSTDWQTASYMAELARLEREIAEEEENGTETNLSEEERAEIEAELAALDAAMTEVGEGDEGTDEEAGEMEENEEEEVKFFEDMDRTELKAFIKERELGFQVVKSWTDDDIRTAIYAKLEDIGTPAVVYVLDEEGNNDE